MKKKIILLSVMLAISLLLSTGANAMYAGSLYFNSNNMGEWAWYIVDEAYECGLMFEVSEDEFAPKAEVSYAELITVLYRLSGSPDVSDCPHTGCSPTWFHDELVWAEENEIIDLKGKDPRVISSRDAAVSIIYSFADHIGVDITDVHSNALNGFTDVNSINADAQDEWCFAVSEGIIRGVGNSTLAPERAVTREQLATIAVRLKNIYLEILYANLPGSDIWDRPIGSTETIQAPNDDGFTVTMNRITNEYLIENKNGDYLCMTGKLDKTNDSYGAYGTSWSYGSLPCYESVYYNMIPFPYVYVTLPNSEYYSITPRYSDSVEIMIDSIISIEGYRIEKITYEKGVITVYGENAILRRHTVYDESSCEIVFADK